MLRRLLGPVFGWMILLLTGLALSAASVAFAGPRPAITAVRVASHDGITRFVMDLSEPVAFTVSNGQNNQIFVDLPDLDWQSESKGLKRGVGVLRTFRYGPAQPGAARLVLETDSPATVQKSFLIPPSSAPNYRLVIDLVSGAPMPPPLSPPSSPAMAQGGNGGNPILSSGGNAGPAPSLVIEAPQAQSQSIKTAAAQPAPPPAQPSTTPAVKPQPASAVIPAAPIGNAGAGDDDGDALPLARKQSHAGKPIIVIDPGHGGVDPGAISLTGAYEKNIVLALAREVKAQLDKSGKVKAVLTRDRDFFIPLRERVSIARAQHADLFMSLHADTVANPDIRGLSVYTLSQHSSDAEAQQLADKENKADIVAGIDLSNESPEVTNILIDLVQRESMNLSAVFATDIIREVQSTTHNVLEVNTHRFAGFAVLKAPDVPSVLVETGYLSNKEDEQMLRRPDYRTKLATTLAHAIERYFSKMQKARHS